MRFDIRSAGTTELDLVSLGECMVRLDAPAHQRLEFARSLDVYVGGAEYNVAYALARLGLRTGWVGGVVDTPLGHRVLSHARAAGVDVSQVIVRDYDGVGRATRMGLHLTEVGSGPRASVSVYDRGHSATSQLLPEDIDWEDLFGRRGVRWFHTGGTFACLSDAAHDVVAAALEAAHREGTIVSYDLNFRSKLWDSETAIAVTKPLVPMIDILIGNEEDFQKVLGYEVEGASGGLEQLDTDSYKRMVRQVVLDFPHLTAVTTTQREVVNANTNNWSAIAYDVEADVFHDSPRYESMAIEDRVGGGDGFASGLAFSLLNGDDLATAARVGTAHGALLQTTRGDTSEITRADLDHVVAGGSARIKR